MRVGALCAGALFAVAWLAFSSTPAQALVGGYYGTASWPAVPVTLDSPADVTVAMDGEVFVADSTGRRIVVLGADGTFLRAFDGSEVAAAELVEPTGLAIGPDARLYVADRAGNKVVVFERSGALVRAFGSAGTAPGSMSGPSGVAVDASGTVYVADTNNDRISEFTASGSYVTTLAAPGDGSGAVRKPSSLSIANGELYVTELTTYRVQVFGLDGSYRREWGPFYDSLYGYISRYLGFGGVEAQASGRVLVSGRLRINASTQVSGVESCTAGGALNGYWGGAGALGTPVGGVATDANGIGLVADSNNRRIARLDLAAASPAWLATWSYEGSSAAGTFSRPSAAAYAPDGSVFVADTLNDRLQKLAADGSPIAVFGTSGGGTVADPAGIAVSADGTEVYVADTGNSRIAVYDGSGTYLRALGGPGAGAGQFASPRAVSVAPDGTLAVADTGNNRVQRISTAGAWLATASSLTAPAGVAVDASGTIYASDTDGHRVRTFNSSGTLTGTWGSFGTGNGSFVYPAGITLGPTGDVFVADAGNNRIQRLTKTGAFVTAIGVRGSGLSELRSPAGVGVSPTGQVLVADTGNSRLQVFELDAVTPVTSASGTYAWYVNHPLTVTLSAEDSASGVREIRYQLGAGSEQVYSGPFTVSAEGETRIRYTSIDRVGNRDTTRTAFARIDTTPPWGTVRIDGGRAFVASTTVSLESSMTDASTMRINPGTGWLTPIAYTATTPVTLPGEGPRTVSVQYFDTLENTRTVETSVTVDLAAPTTEIHGIPASGITSIPVGVSLTFADARSGVATTLVSVDGAAEQLYQGLFTLSAEGEHTVVARSIDAVGNAEDPVSATFEIDSTPPTGTVTVEGGAAIVDTTTVAVEPSVSGATEMRFNAGSGFDDWRPYAAHHDVTLAGEGLRTIRSQFLDTAFNSTEIVSQLTVDLSPPSTVATGLPASGLTAFDVVVSLVPTDTYSAISGTYYSLDGAADEPYGGPITVTAEGPHTLTYYAVDALGHVESRSATATFEIDRRAPDGAIGLANGRASASSTTPLISLDLTNTAHVRFDTGSGYGEWQPWTPTVTLDLGAEGEHEIEVGLRSLAGREVTRSVSVPVDLTAPRFGPVTVTPSRLVPQAAGAWAYDVGFTWTAREPGPVDSGLSAYRWRFGANGGSSAAPSVTAVEQRYGSALRVSVTDGAGNAASMQRVVRLWAGAKPVVPTSVRRAGSSNTVWMPLATPPARGDRYVLRCFKQSGGDYVLAGTAAARAVKVGGAWRLYAKPVFAAGLWRVAFQADATNAVSLGQASEAVTVQ